MTAFTKHQTFTLSFFSFSSPTSLITLSPVVPLPCKLNHSFFPCVSCSSSRLYAHRLPPSLMTLPRRLSEDLEEGGRRRQSSCPMRGKSSEECEKLSFRQVHRGWERSHPLGGRRGTLDRSQPWRRGSSDDAGPWERLVPPPLRCPIGHRLENLLTSVYSHKQTLPAALLPPEWNQSVGGTFEECVSINRAVRLSRSLMTSMTRFLKGTPVMYLLPMPYIHWL